MYLRHDDASPAAHEQASRIDRTRGLWIGISAAITALWSLYRVFWLFYAATALSSVGYTGVSLILWGAIAVVAGSASAITLLRYSKQP